MQYYLKCKKVEGLKYWNINAPQSIFRYLKTGFEPSHLFLATPTQNLYYYIRKVKALQDWTDFLVIIQI